MAAKGEKQQYDGQGTQQPSALQRYEALFTSLQATQKITPEQALQLYELETAKLRELAGRQAATHPDLKHRDNLIAAWKKGDFHLAYYLFVSKAVDASYVGNIDLVKLYFHCAEAFMTEGNHLFSLQLREGAARQAGERIEIEHAPTGEVPNLRDLYDDTVADLYNFEPEGEMLPLMEAALRLDQARLQETDQVAALEQHYNQLFQEFLTRYIDQASQAALVQGTLVQQMISHPDIFETPEFQRAEEGYKQMMDEMKQKSELTFEEVLTIFRTAKQFLSQLEDPNGTRFAAQRQSVQEVLDAAEKGDYFKILSSCYLMAGVQKDAGNIAAAFVFINCARTIIHEADEIITTPEARALWMAAVYDVLREQKVTPLALFIAGERAHRFIKDPEVDEEAKLMSAFQNNVLVHEFLGGELDIEQKIAREYFFIQLEQETDLDVTDVFNILHREMDEAITRFDNLLLSDQRYSDSTELSRQETSELVSALREWSIDETRVLAIERIYDLALQAMNTGNIRRGQFFLSMADLLLSERLFGGENSFNKSEKLRLYSVFWLELQKKLVEIEKRYKGNAERLAQRKKAWQLANAALKLDEAIAVSKYPEEQRDQDVMVMRRMSELDALYTAVTPVQEDLEEDEV
jgi:hypothetical protein